MRAERGRYARGGRDRRGGERGMYGWFWRHLPGNAWVRAAISIVLGLIVVYLLFQYVFPWAEPLLPFNDVTVDGGGAAG
ncbi:hypothetical protein [Streptomyces fuscigenes]|uniref:hypothetical protein n=1 Tax=Streptomyces fuscigenes TaxID=1528880 RepID=UPI001F25A7CA|nr:hypothetical protein [Streptomyces fuscigenes]MCF3963251.1 hypothetical protein [Streptomyces fuscigenes]